MKRRTFIENTVKFAALTGLYQFSCEVPDKRLLFRISLAQWSLHNTFFGDARDKLGYEKFVEGLRTDSVVTMTGAITNLDFPAIARKTYGIEAVEYVNQFFLDKAEDEKYLAELRDRAAQQGVKNLLIMIDLEGNLGASDPAEREGSVKNHKKWINAAAFLGCHSIRVNAYGDGSPDEQRDQVAESLFHLVQYGDENNINVIIENHGGLSSDAQWLTAVMKQVNHKRVGTLPDFGNFPEKADIYKGIKQMMPFAKGVSAKSGQFDEQGNETKIDYYKMLKIVLDSGYRGYIGIESGGPSPEQEKEGIIKTKALLERIRDQYAEKYAG
jgi:sugar phosphate isomerase/epimerase